MVEQSTTAPWIRWSGQAPMRGAVADCRGSWTDNVELLLFAIGGKPAVKVEDQSPEEVAELRSLLQGQGALMEAIERDSGPSPEARDMDSGTGARSFQVFLSRESSAIPQLMEMERKERGGGNQRARAIARSGELLGYPTCCIRFFADLPSQDDAAVLEAYRGQVGNDIKADPLFNIFPPMVSPVTWFPCSFACAETMARATDAAVRIEQFTGNFKERMRRLSGVTIVFRRFLFVHLHEAVVAGDWIEYSSVSDALSWTNDPLFVESKPLQAFREQVAECLAVGSALRLLEGGLDVRVKGDARLLQGHFEQVPLVFHFGNA